MKRRLIRAGYSYDLTATVRVPALVRTVRILVQEGYSYRRGRRRVVVPARYEEETYLARRAYTYERVVGTVKVPPKYEEIVEKKPPVKKPPAKKKPPVKKPPVEEPEEIEEPEEERRLPSLPDPEGKGGWTVAAEHQEAVDEAVEGEGFDVEDHDGIIAHADPDSDWVHNESLFVWGTRRIPMQLDIPGLPHGVVFTRIRIYFWVCNTNEETASQWARTAWTPEAMNWYDAWDEAKKLFADVKSDLEKRFDYISVLGHMVAWTAYPGNEKAPTRPPSGVGGTEPEDDE